MLFFMKSRKSGLFIIFFAICTMMITASAHAADVFGKYNPDIKKYEFARSYITALGYMKEIQDRWDKNAPKKLFAHQRNQVFH